MSDEYDKSRDDEAWKAVQAVIARGPSTPGEEGKRQHFAEIMAAVTAWERAVYGSADDKPLVPRDRAERDLRRHFDEERARHANDPKELELIDWAERDFFYDHRRENAQSKSRLAVLGRPAGLLALAALLLAAWHAFEAGFDFWLESVVPTPLERFFAESDAERARLAPDPEWWSPSVWGEFHKTMKRRRTELAECRRYATTPDLAVLDVWLEGQYGPTVPASVTFVDPPIEGTALAECIRRVVRATTFFSSDRVPYVLEWLPAEESPAP